MKARLAALALSLVLVLGLSLPGLAAPAARYRVLPEVADPPIAFDGPLSLRFPVGPEWFSDAIFIGDARLGELAAAGLFQPGLSLAQVGLNLRDLLGGTPFTKNGERASLEQMLEGVEFRKVYLMLGLNEAAWMGEEEFYREYSALIDRLRELLPGAQIYVQTLIPVTLSRAAAQSPDNAVLAQRSALLVGLAQTKRVYLLKVGEHFTGSAGALTPGLSSDGLHLTDQGNQLWFQYLQTHAVGS